MSRDDDPPPDYQDPSAQGIDPLMHYTAMTRSQFEFGNEEPSPPHIDPTQGPSMQYDTAGFEDTASSQFLMQPSPFQFPMQPSPSQFPTQPTPSQFLLQPTSSHFPLQPAPSPFPTQPGPSQFPMQPASNVQHALPNIPNNHTSGATDTELNILMRRDLKGKQRASQDVMGPAPKRRGTQVGYVRNINFSDWEVHDVAKTSAASQVSMKPGQSSAESTPRASNKRAPSASKAKASGSSTPRKRGPKGKSSSPSKSPTGPAPEKQEIQVAYGKSVIYEPWLPDADLLAEIPAGINDLEVYDTKMSDLWEGPDKKTRDLWEAEDKKIRDLWKVQVTSTGLSTARNMGGNSPLIGPALTLKEQTDVAVGISGGIFIDDFLDFSLYSSE